MKEHFYNILQLCCRGVEEGKRTHTLNSQNRIRHLCISPCGVNGLQRLVVFSHFLFYKSWRLHCLFFIQQNKSNISFTTV